RLPLRCELLGSALNAALLAVLPLIFGLPGIPLAALGGVLCTALLLMRRQALLGALPWARLWLLSALAMALAAGLLFRIDGIWLQLGLGTVAGCLALLGMALWLRPWRTD
ncbi:TPA: murein biosynthesis integral membrane protein MurJ, partial [Pseudomonas aeruginosa]